MSHTDSYLQSVSPTQIEVENLVNCLLLDALEYSASDIHVEPWENSLFVRARISGRLVDLTHLPIHFKDKISGRFKVMGGMLSHVTGIGQSGKANLGENFQNAQLRISIMPTLLGEKIVCRIFNPTTVAFDLNELGFDGPTLKQYKDLLRQPSGLILLNGPSGSGKTTTMYSSLAYLLKKQGTGISIASVEDPVEVQIERVSQAELNPRGDFGFAQALKSLMTQDAEVIMVSDIPDLESARTVIQMGLTGHVVISTMPAASSAGVFDRLLSMNIEPYLVSSSILGVLGVRLLRRVCSNCAVPDEEAARYLEGLTEEQLAQANFLKGNGCEACGFSGYSGRLFLTELLQVGGPVRDAILEKKSARHISEVCTAAGMHTLWDSGIEKVMAGETTLREITRNLSSQ